MCICYSLSSKFALPARSPAIQRELRDGLSLTVQANCTGHAVRTCAELQEQIAGKPIPLMQLAIAREVSFANYAGIALTCRLTLDMI